MYKKVDPFISQPFGYGPRQCIGTHTSVIWNNSSSTTLFYFLAAAANSKLTFILSIHTY